ncbi:MAG TPA: AMP-binding protein [Trebonia sp.]
MIRDWIEQAAACQGSAVYLAEARGSGTLSYAGLRAAAGVWERRLDDAGLPPGTPIAVRHPEPLEYATALLAIVAAGRVAVPLDPGAPPAEAARVLAVARPAATVTNGPFGLDTPLIAGGTPAAGGFRGVAPPGKQSSERDCGDCGIFLCTSGTTGTPKGILLRDEQLAHTAASVVSAHRLTRADRGYCSLPLFHVNAEVVGLLATLRAGAYLAVDRKFSRRGFWEMIAEQRITWINAVPAIISILAMNPPAARPETVRFARSASAPLPPSALERFEGAVGVPVIETYGMTEAASMITANPLDGPRKPGSAGRPAGTEVRVETPDGAAAPGEVGRVRIRGGGVIRGYASGGRPGVIDADGWLDTGDLGYLDSGGYLFLVGRSDDVINRGGEKIYPREIEEILLAQPGVRAAAVTGAADEVLGERPVACVVPDAGWPAGDVEALLRKACAAELPRHKQPSEYRLVAELPLGSTGKISRRALKDLVAAAR